MTHGLLIYQLNAQAQQQPCGFKSAEDRALKRIIKKINVVINGFTEVTLTKISAPKLAAAKVTCGEISAV